MRNAEELITASNKLHLIKKTSEDELECDMPDEACQAAQDKAADNAKLAIAMLNLQSPTDTNPIAEKTNSALYKNRKYGNGRKFSQAA